MLALTLALLSATPAPVASFSTGIAHVTEFGKRDARPLLLIPGLACGPWVWDDQIAALAPKYDVFAISLPGFDGRPMVSGDDLMRRAVDSLHRLIRARRLVRAIVVGHSLGGTLAVLFGETYPGEAANVVSVEGGYPIAPTQRRRDAAVARSVAPYQHVAQAQLGAALRQNMLQYTIARRSDVDRATALAGRSDPQAIVAWMEAALSLDLTPLLYRIAVPFTVIVPFDPVIDPYQGYATAADKLGAYRIWVHHAPRGEVVMIENARHFVMIDRPRAFEHALENAIER